MQVRYRYRIYPSPGQQQALARVFGCARVVYNDCLRVRDEAYVAGEKISDTEVQRRVITLAKATPERAWLAGVASVALVQACQDARRAYKNWFESLKDRRKGPKIRHPKPRRKRGRQSIRLTRNGFALHGERLYVAKVGDLKVEWSRALPSVPSSVTVIGGFRNGFMARVISDRLEATPAQEKVIRDATEEFRESLAKLRGEGRKTRADVASTFRKGHFDEVLFGELFARHDNALTDVRKAFVGMGARIHDALDEKQRARAFADLIESGPGAWRPRARGRGWS